MLHRLAFPLIFMLGPRVLPWLIRYSRLVWKLQWDKRVSIVLRALIPLSILYFILPIGLIPDRIPRLGYADDVIFLALAVLLLVKLSPPEVVNEHLGKPKSSNRPEDKDPSKVVDGTSKLIDE